MAKPQREVRRRRPGRHYSLSPETVVRIEMLAEDAELPPSRLLDQLVLEQARKARLQAAEVRRRCNRLRRAERLV